MSRKPISLPPEPTDSALAQFPIVGIGASAGGLEAFTQLLEMLPANTGMAFVLIQHLDPEHTSFLRDALARSTQMPLSQAEDGVVVEPNHVYVIPPKADLAIRDGRLVLVPRPKEARGTPHLPVDSFLRALAAERGNHAIGVVLSGTASDGTEGLRAIKASDGITLAQEPRSAKFPGMPRSAIQAGVVDYALSIPELAAELIRLSRHPYVAALPAPPDADEDTFKKILALVRGRVGVDFASYKSPTVRRRLARRMALRRVDDLGAYLSVVRAEPDEAQALFEDILIHVTSFFRDPESFALLKEQVFPAILQSKAVDAPVRMWVAGCSSGEEVYSLAIALLESMDDSSRQIQIFGSDVSARSIARARAGLYPDAALREIGDERRRRYFTRVEGGHRIVKSVRDMCVFVEHNLARDPPFSKLDLVTCRNVLIYFDAPLQHRVLSRFHYALNQPGYLLLGRTEAITGFGDLFTPVDRSCKVFARSAVKSTLRFALGTETRPTGREMAVDRGLPEPRRATDLAQRADRLILSRYAPPGALVNERMEVVKYLGETGAFLRPTPGPPQHNIIKLARGGLLAALRATIARAKKEMAPARAEGVTVEQEGLTRTCDVVVIPVAGAPGDKERYFVVLFEDRDAANPARPRGTKAAAPRGKNDPRVVARLETELVAIKDYLYSLVEEHDRASDDLGVANEELISGNEELQSMNEELETAKEELQSANEELTTVNDELHSRNLELGRVNSDLVNVLGTVEIPIVILDLHRRIRRYTPNARKILSVLPSDVGRPIDDIKLNIDVPDLTAQIAEVMDTTAVKESEVQDLAGSWYRMQIGPYRTTDNIVDGAILSLVDIDALKHHLAEVQRARGEAERANLAKDQFLATLSHELRTPLSSMLMHAQLLTRGGMDDDKLRRAGEAIERGTKLQLKLIEDLLDISRIVAGKLKLDLGTVKLADVVRDAVEAGRAPADRKSIAIETSIASAFDLRVAGDPTRLQQIVSNLLTNAIKFTPENGRVTLRLEGAGRDARISVTDTGIGMDTAFLARAFTRFTQEDGSATRAYGGLGLGLAIVRHLVELHGGTVEAVSPGKGKGTTVTVTLPLLVAPGSEASAGVPATEANIRPPPVAGPDGELRDLAALVIDDDEETREAVAEVLHQRGASVTKAGSTAEAMAAIESGRPDVLVCDIAMPGEDGLSFIRRLRALGAARGGDTRALALSAMAGDDDRRRALAAGFQLHLTKPVEMDRLVEAIAALCERSPGVGPRPKLGAGPRSDVV